MTWPSRKQVAGNHGRGDHLRCSLSPPISAWSIDAVGRGITKLFTTFDAIGSRHDQCRKIDQDRTNEADARRTGDATRGGRPAAEAEPPESPSRRDGAAEAEPHPASPAKKWYIIHTYSGFEQKVAESLRSRAEASASPTRSGRS